MICRRSECASNVVHPTLRIAVHIPFTITKRSICVSVKAIYVIAHQHSRMDWTWAKSSYLVLRYLHFGCWIDIEDDQLVAILKISSTINLIKCNRWGINCTACVTHDCWFDLLIYEICSDQGICVYIIFIILKK